MDENVRAPELKSVVSLQRPATVQLQKTEAENLSAKAEMSAILRKPGLLWLEITPGCNLRCEHCYTESSPQLNYPDKVNWSGVLSDAYRIGYRRVQFIGGEPTKNKQLPALIDQARAIGYSSIEVYSNLTMLSNKLLQNFKKNKVNVATSFYSPKEEVHESITRTKGSFRKTVEGIRKTVDAGLNLRVGMVLFETNKGDLKDSVDFLVSIGVKKNRIKYDYVRPVGRGENLTSPKNLEETLCGNCWKGSMTVSWDGSVYPCVFSRHVDIGNVTEQGLEKLVASVKLKSFRELIYDSWLKKHGSKRPKSESCIPSCDPSYNSCSPDECLPEDDRSSSSSCIPSCDPSYNSCSPDECLPESEPPS